MYLYVRNHALHCNVKFNFTLISTLFKLSLHLYC
jgi:hypothetical protein